MFAPAPTQHLLLRFVGAVTDGHVTSTLGRLNRHQGLPFCRPPSTFDDHARIRAWNALHLLNLENCVAGATK